MDHTLKRRILGLDFGNKTCGVAVSDQLGMSAHGVEIIRREKKTKLRATYRRIGELIEEYDPEKIVLGLPLNMDNSEGWRVEDTYAFRDELVSKFGLPVILTDERLTTVEAYEIMEETQYLCGSGAHLCGGAHGAADDSVCGVDGGEDPVWRGGDRFHFQLLLQNGR